MRVVIVKMAARNQYSKCVRTDRKKSIRVFSAKVLLGSTEK